MNNEVHNPINLPTVTYRKSGLMGRRTSLDAAVKTKIIVIKNGTTVIHSDNVL